MKLISTQNWKFFIERELHSLFIGLLHFQGNISRQEAVSMIPPLLLDVKPGQKVCIYLKLQELCIHVPTQAPSVQLRISTNS